MRKNSLARQVRRAYRQDELARVCTLREDRFGRAFGMETVRIPTGRKSSSRWSSPGLPEDYYHFRDNNSSVLAVAHLDTVVRQQGRVPHFRNTERGPLVTSGALDDRLGAYVITHLLPKLGISCDWLFTVGEESGASTAEFFDARGKKYDWAIEFDRGGTDVVMYQYEDQASRRLVEAAGAQMDWGSFSDIAYLEHLGVKAFNWGVGYGGNYHSEAGYAYLEDTFSMVAKYLRFHEQNAGTRLPHDPDSGRYGSRLFSPGGYRSQYDDDYGLCDSCGEHAVDSVTWYCVFCGICQDCGATDPDVAADWNDPDVEVCQCYAPKRLRDEAAEAGSSDIAVTAAGRERDDWTGMTWSEYLANRPGPDSPDDDPDDLKDAHEDAQQVDSPGTLISAAPPWSEHRPDVSHGLGFPTGRKSSRDRGGEAGLSGNLVTAVTEYAGRHDLGWHEATTTGRFVVGHRPSQTWAGICLRCAARWPHPVADGGLPDTDGGLPVHPEFDCPGCPRCLDMKAEARLATGAIHVIAAHLGSDGDATMTVDNCPLCDAEVAANRALSEYDRGDNSAKVHQAKANAARLDR